MSTQILKPAHEATEDGSCFIQYPGLRFKEDEKVIKVMEVELLGRCRGLSHGLVHGPVSFKAQYNFLLLYSSVLHDGYGSPKRRILTHVNYVLWVAQGLWNVCDLEMGITILRGPLKMHASFQRWTVLNGCGQALGCHMVGWKFWVDFGTLTMIVWTIGSRVHHKSSARKITHKSTHYCLRP